MVGWKRGGEESGGVAFFGSGIEIEMDDVVVFAT
jgi:hypothetical protein